MVDKIAEVMKRVRERTPLVQCITNYVTVNDVANILICFGASPAMVEVRGEVEEFAAAISALYINLGTLTGEQKEAAIAAARRATELGKPVVLDPVACGAISRKMDVIDRLLECSRIAVIKGNTGEIKSLAGYSGKMRGMDSVDEGEDLPEACRTLAERSNTVVVATGKTDVVTDGRRTCLVDNGTPLFGAITGSGCMAGALVAAAAAVESDLFAASTAAMAAMGVAGEMAAELAGPNTPGTFRVRLFDAVYALTGEEVAKRCRIRLV
ncbi:MAG: hydroxyethylthiazole kinase [Thermacetogenium sp.]|jgi:hydroxyethylthiazole kinase|nr:hydroxyethylthiazole kinase [Thermacetogenium sp.]